MITNVFIIDGTKMPTPTEIKWGEYIISKAQRNLMGDMAFSYITKKIRADISYAALKQEDMKLLKYGLYVLNNGKGKAIHTVQIIGPSLRYLNDPVDTITFDAYVGDLEYSTLMQKPNGEIWYRDVTVQLIQL